MLLLSILILSVLFTIFSIPQQYTRPNRIILNSTIVQDGKYDHIAIALKTGKDVALKRTPIQFLTFLSRVKNVIMIGEAPGVFVGDVPMIDVYTNLYKQKRSEEELKPDENSLGWKSDAHKNIPVFLFD
jgi:hypothetical protein